jgi:hypothetical protein
MGTAVLVRKTKNTTSAQTLCDISHYLNLATTDTIKELLQQQLRDLNVLKERLNFARFNSLKCY